MNRWHNYYVDGCAHFCTAVVLDHEAVFNDAAIEQLYKIWDEARKRFDVRILAYVVMPDHIHVLLWAEKGASVQTFLQQTLSKMAKRMNRRTLWEERARVFPCYSRSVLQVKVDYIHRNPVRKKLVVNPEEWRHSSFRQLNELHGEEPFVCDSWDGLV